MERLLITGVDYALGATLAHKLSDRCAVLGLYRDAAVTCQGVQTAYWPSGDPLALANLWHEWRPHWAIHCGVLAGSNWDLPLAGTRHRTDEPRTVSTLAQLAAESGARLTVMSSDAVFAGPRMFHEEHSPATSTAPWAEPLRAMESAALAGQCLVVRTHAYGWSPFAAHAGYAQQAHAALLNGQPVVADGMRHATPIYAADLAEPLWRAFELRLHGLYHLAGAERTSTHRFVCQLADLLGAPLPLASPVPHADDGTLPDETSLNSKRIRRTLEMATPLLREGLQRFVDDGSSQWRTLGRVAPREAAA